MTVTEIEARFLTAIQAAVEQRAPYVWGGKGDQIWTPEGVIANPFPVEVFDCSGLITTCLHRAGGPDLRFTHGAKHLRALLPERGAGLRLRFYPGHVALHVPIMMQVAEELETPFAIVIEAAGGDSQTLAPTPGGFVRRGKERRRDFLSEGSLSAYLWSLPG